MIKGIMSHIRKLLPRSAQQPETMIKGLLNRNAEFGDRHDCAGYLGEYDDPKVEEALIKVGSDNTEDEFLTSECGSSLATIWIRKGRVNAESLVTLTKPALKEAVALLEKKPKFNESIQEIKQKRIKDFE